MDDSLTPEQMRERNEQLIALLERGVPFFLAFEALSSTALDRELRVQTHSARSSQRPPNSSD